MNYKLWDRQETINGLPPSHFLSKEIFKDYTGDIILIYSENGKVSNIECKDVLAEVFGIDKTLSLDNFMTQYFATIEELNRKNEGATVVGQGETLELSGEYVGSSINVTDNGSVDIKTLIKNKEIPFTVEVNVPKGIFPTGTKDITENGTHNIREYNLVNVQVPIPEGYLKPSGNIEISTTSTIDVKQYETAKVVDSNLLPENIAKDVTILGVVGTHEGGGTEGEDALILGNFTSYTNTRVSEIGSYAFYGRSLTEINFPNVNFIEQRAFASCSKLTTINLPKCISLSEGAFQSCTALSKVMLPKFSVAFGDLIFANCTALVDVDLPVIESLNETAMFQNCSNLKTINFPKCSYIGTETFYGCGFESIDFPQIKAIASNAFAYCQNLTSINLPNCTSFSGSVFANCSNLMQIELSACDTLGSSMFAYCRNLETVSIPNGTCVGGSVFYNCSNFTSLYMPNCSTIGDSAFYNCSKLESFYVYATSAKLGRNTFKYTPIYNSSYLGHYGSIYVPASLVSLYKYATNWTSYSSRITSLPSECDTQYVYVHEFNSSDITQVPDNKINANYILAYAFNSCSNLLEANFPSCSYIGPSAFQSCTSLLEANFLNCTYVGVSAFFGCSSLVNANFPSCSYIGPSAFNSCSNLLEANFPSCTYVGVSAFYGCSNLTSITLSSCSYIMDEAFCYCIKLQNLSLPDCTKILDAAFQDCSSLTEIVFPNCDYIGRNAFASCSKLTTINLPKCTFFGNNAFGDCYNLESVNISECVRLGDFAFDSCSSLTSISLPNCNYIGDSTFRSCKNLTSISLPNCNYIGYNAFGYCRNLSQIFLNVSQVPVINYTFNSFDKLKIYVPTSLYNQFIVAHGWSKVTNLIVAMDFTD